MGPRIKLFQTERQEAPKTIHMVLEDMQSAMLEIEASAAENPNIAPVATPQEEALLEVVIAREEQELEAIGEVVDSSLPAIGALEDTAYVIAPTITEARASDIALVRQIAVTASDSLGLPPEDLLKDVDSAVIGQPLVLEGFKEKAILAARAVWNAILNALDRAWTLFQSSFRRTAGRLKKLNGVISDISSSKPKGTIKTTASMKALTTDGSMTSDDVEMACRVFITYYRLATTQMNMTQQMYTKVVSVISRVKAASEIPAAFNSAAQDIVGIYSDPDYGGKLFSIEGDDLVAKHVLNGSRLKFTKLGAAVKAMAADGLASASEFSSVQLVSVAEDIKLVDSVEYDADDFTTVAASIGTLIKDYNPNQINHLNGIVRKSKRDVQTMSDKVLNDWVSLIDKAPTEEQAALRPYVAAVSQLINKQAHLSTQLYTKAVSTLDTIITAGTQLLEQGVSAKKDTPKE